MIAPKVYTGQMKRAQVKRLHPKTFKIVENSDGWIVFFDKDSFLLWSNQMKNFLDSRKRPEKENPSYAHHGATFDLFGGESRALPKKASDVSRPRVRVHGHTVTFAKHSPFKGKVENANAGARAVFRPVKIELSAKEVPSGKPSKALISKVLNMAAQSKTDWDHVEVTNARGKHLFDLVP